MSKSKKIILTIFPIFFCIVTLASDVKGFWFLHKNKSGFPVNKFYYFVDKKVFLLYDTSQFAFEKIQFKSSYLDVKTIDKNYLKISFNKICDSDKIFILYESKVVDSIGCYFSYYDFTFSPIGQSHKCLIGSDYIRIGLYFEERNGYDFDSSEETFKLLSYTYSIMDSNMNRIWSKIIDKSYDRTSIKVDKSKIDSLLSINNLYFVIENINIKGATKYYNIPRYIFCRSQVITDRDGKANVFGKFITNDTIYNYRVSSYQ